MMEYAADEAGPRKLLGRASIVAAGTVYQQGISFVSGLIVARVIGASDYGIFSLARNLVDVTGILTRMGLQIGLQRFFGETNTARDRASRIVVLRRVRLLASTLALLPVIAVALGLGRVLEANVYQYSRFGEILLCLALALPFSTDIAVLGGAYRGILKLPPSVIAECVLLPTIRLAAIVILFMVGWRLWAVVVGTTLASFLASAFLAMRARSDFRGDAPAQPQSWDDAFRVLRYSSVLALAGLVVTLTSSMDTLMLGRFTTAQDLGQYSLVKMLLMLMAVFGGAFVTGLGALVAERHSRGDVDGMVRVMSLIARWNALVTVPIFAIFLFWGAELTLLFGPSFGASQAVVSWLAASQFVFMIFGPSGWALSMTGRHVLELKILSTGLVIATLLCWAAVPAFGQLGAAVATCTSVATVNIARVLFVRHAIGAFSFGSDVIVITAAGIGLAWGSSAVVAQFALPPFWEAIAGIGSFALAYTVAACMRLLSESEKCAIQEAISSTTRMVFTRTP
jgi:O-antigen/teichoic acid export membrane protein